jgi:hypothetical protein
MVCLPAEERGGNGRKLAAELGVADGARLGDVTEQARRGRRRQQWRGARGARALPFIGAWAAAPGVCGTHAEGGGLARPALAAGPGWALAG